MIGVSCRSAVEYASLVYIVAKLISLKITHTKQINIQFIILAKCDYSKEDSVLSYCFLKQRKS